MINNGLDSKNLENIFFEILQKANPEDVSDLINHLKTQQISDIENQWNSGEFVISEKSTEELSRFYEKLSKNIDHFFSGDNADKFLKDFYDSLEVAKRNLELNSPLRPESRLELSPSAYSGFQDKLSTKKFANTLFILALASYANQKSGEKILDIDKFFDVQNAMHNNSLRLKKNQEKSPIVFYNFNAKSSEAAIYFASLLLICSSLSGLAVLGSKNKSEENADKNNDSKSTSAKQNPFYIVSNIIVAWMRLFSDTGPSLKNPGLGFILAGITSLSALECFYESIGKKNYIKTFIDDDKPVQIDNIIMVDLLKMSLLAGSILNPKMHPARISNKFYEWIKNCSTCLFSNNCVKNQETFKINNIDKNEIKITEEQIKVLARELKSSLNNVIENKLQSPVNNASGASAERIDKGRNPNLNNI